MLRIFYILYCIACILRNVTFLKFPASQLIIMYQILENGSVSSRNLVLSASPRLQEGILYIGTIVTRHDSHHSLMEKTSVGEGSRRGGSGELVIKEGELARVYSRADRLD